MFIDKVFILFRRSLYTLVLLLALFLYVFSGVFFSMIRETNSHPLWQDEFLTLSYLVPPMGALISYNLSGENPYFPAYFVLSKPWYDLAVQINMNVNWTARIGTIATSSILILLVYGVILFSQNRIRSTLIIIIGFLLLSYDSSFKEHAVEARMYGLLNLSFVMLIALIVASNKPAIILVSCLLILLHPIGSLIGVPIAFVTILLEVNKARILFLKRKSHLNTDWLKYTPLLVASLVFLLTIILVSKLVVSKYLGEGSYGFAIKQGSHGLANILEYINAKPIWIGHIIIISLLGIGIVARIRKVTLPYVYNWDLVITFFVLMLTVTVFKMKGAIFPVANIPVSRYIDWLNSGVMLAVIASGVALVETIAFWAYRKTGQVYDVALEVLLVPLVLICHSSWSKVSLGPPWGDGLVEAAQFISMNASFDAGIASNNAEMYALPNSLSRGFRCERATQIVAYLDPSRRRQIICERDGVVSAEGFSEFWYVEEPIDWKGPREVRPGSLPLIGKRRFGNAWVSLYGVETEGKPLPVLEENTIKVPERQEGTLIVALKVPPKVDLGRLPQSILLLGSSGAIPDINGQGFTLYHFGGWTTRETPMFACAVSHDGETALYGVHGRFEKYLWFNPRLETKGKDSIAIFALTWQNSSDGAYFAISGNPESKDWQGVSFSFKDLKARSVSLPIGKLTSSYEIIRMVTLDQFYSKYSSKQLQYEAFKFVNAVLYP